jgi:hypothetical protein
MKTHTLKLRWTVSKAKDSYGYNVLTLLDGDDKYKTSGGGYDMQGTVFANWLQAKFFPKIIEICRPKKDEFYGYYDTSYGQYLSGACGLDCMIKIAKAIGLGVQQVYCPKIRNLEFIIVTEPE